MASEETLQADARRWIHGTATSFNDLVIKHSTLLFVFAVFLPSRPPAHRLFYCEETSNQSLFFHKQCSIGTTITPQRNNSPHLSRGAHHHAGYMLLRCGAPPSRARVYSSKSFASYTSSDSAGSPSTPLVVPTPPSPSCLTHPTKRNPKSNTSNQPNKIYPTSKKLVVIISTFTAVKD